MRVVTSTLYRHSNNLLSDRISELHEVQKKLMTGKRVSRPSDDPTEISNILEFKSLISEHTQYQKNNQAGQATLRENESILESLYNDAKRANELYIQGKGGVIHQDEKKILSNSLSQIARHMSAIVNTRGINGYVMNGDKTNTPPIDIIRVEPVLVGNQFMQNGKPISNMLPISTNYSGEGEDYKIDYVNGALISGNVRSNFSIEYIKENPLSSEKLK